MANLVGLTELIFDGKTLIIYILICQNFGVLYQVTSKQSFGNENCKKGLQENPYSSKLENVCTVTQFRRFSRKLHTS